MKKLIYTLFLLPCLVSGQGASGWFAKSFDNATLPTYPDSVFTEGEHWNVHGSAGIVYRYGASNDTAVGNLNTNSNNYMYRTITTPHDSIYVVGKVNTAGTMVDVLVNDLVEVNDYVITTSGNPTGFGIPIALAIGDVIRIRAVTNFIEVDYVIFYYQYE